MKTPKTQTKNQDTIFDKILGICNLVLGIVILNNSMGKFLNCLIGLICLIGGSYTLSKYLK